MTVKTPEGNHITGKPILIVDLMKEAHFTACDLSIEGYMERVKEDLQRLLGIELSSENPEAFLRSLAQHNMITIEEAA